MFEKIKEILTKKDKKVENLISLLIILIITLICINYIMKDDSKEAEEEKHKGAVLASTTEVSSSELESRIENILSKIDGVGKVSVLLTYNEENLEGVVVVAEGVKDIDTRVDIISAIEVITGLGKHKIKVYEMKEYENEGGNYGEKD
ncbi:MAG: hypothetical protein J6A36_03725 [Clostridia bacterium]|nr:hypothetical protein [Clostridia bacterium]